MPTGIIIEHVPANAMSMRETALFLYGALSAVEQLGEPQARGVRRALKVAAVSLWPGQEPPLAEEERGT